PPTSAPPGGSPTAAPPGLTGTFPDPTAGRGTVAGARFRAMPARSRRAGFVAGAARAKARPQTNTASRTSPAREAVTRSDPTAASGAAPPFTRIVMPHTIHRHTRYCNRKIRPGPPRLRRPGLAPGTSPKSGEGEGAFGAAAGGPGALGAALLV